MEELLQSVDEFIKEAQQTLETANEKLQTVAEDTQQAMVEQDTAAVSKYFTPRNLGLAAVTGLTGYIIYDLIKQ